MNNADAYARGLLALALTLAAVVGVIVLGVAIIAFAEERSQAAQYVLTSLLPVIGTWVGTILAFYFGKANFEAAGNLAKQLSPLDRLRQIPAKEKMIRKDQMFFKQLPVNALKIADVLAEMAAKNKGSRLPILDAGLAAKYIVHRSMLDQYLAQQSTAGRPTQDLTFEDLFKDRQDLATMFQTSFGAVPPDATLADAKLVMQQTPRCEDVFVTLNGGAGDPVIGWITDNIIQQNLNT